MGTVHVFFAAMLCFPDAQKKAQEELDRVLNGRLPDFRDEKDLPYMAALVKEVLRWKPVTPLGMSMNNRHEFFVDRNRSGSTLFDERRRVHGVPYSKRCFHDRKCLVGILPCLLSPARQYLSVHARAMLHDEDDYPDPTAFHPERFLKDGKLDPSVRDPSQMAFGFGRR